MHRRRNPVSRTADISTLSIPSVVCGWQLRTRVRSWLAGRPAPPAPVDSWLNAITSRHVLSRLPRRRVGRQPPHLAVLAKPDQRPPAYRSRPFYLPSVAFLRGGHGIPCPPEFGLAPRLPPLFIHKAHNVPHTTRVVTPQVVTTVKTAPRVFALPTFMLAP